MQETVTTLIAPDNHWALLAVLFSCTGLSIWLEQKYKWASKVSGAIIALLAAMLLVNLRIIPASAPVFDDVVWGYAVPLAIPLLLLQTNMRRIRKETGCFLLIFLIGAAGTVAGAVLATVLLRGRVEGLERVAAMMTGSYIGGGVNFTAITAAFKVDGGLISAASSPGGSPRTAGGRKCSTPSWAVPTCGSPTSRCSSPPSARSRPARCGAPRSWAHG